MTRLLLVALMAFSFSCATTDTCPPDADGVQEESCLEARRTFWAVISDLITTGGDRANTELEEAGDE
jgi:hypothetical protein